MNLIVCLKQVPATTEVRLDPVTKTILRDGRQSVTNPFDSHALELAVTLKERFGGTVSALTMGIPAAEGMLRDALGRGADRALLLSDRAFAGSDTLATAYALSLGVRRLGEADLILCGKMAVDGDTAQIGPELAEHLGIPHVCDVCEIKDASETRLLCCRITDAGEELVEVPLPAVITVTREINLPRLPSIPGIRFSRTGPVETLTADALGAARGRGGRGGAPPPGVRVYTPPREREAEQIAGTSAEQARALKSLIREVLPWRSFK